MAMINTSDIVETIKMIEEEHLDIRTITMGISLRDLASDDIKVLSDKIYDKVPSIWSQPVNRSSVSWVFRSSTSVSRLPRSP